MRIFRRDPRGTKRRERCRRALEKRWENLRIFLDGAAAVCYIDIRSWTWRAYFFAPKFSRTRRRSAFYGTRLKMGKELPCVQKSP